MAESRQDYLNWINSLLSLQLTRIEDLGKGDVFCQIFDSIFLDVPLKKVKFNAKHEFEFISNFKVLQTTFDKHKIPNQINVEKLVKLKFQDNFEFCQFAKKYWDAHFPCHAYDAVGRRTGVVPSVHVGAPKVSLGGTGHALKVKGSGGGGLVGGGMDPVQPPSRATASTEFMQLQLQEAQTHLVTMEKERDFYYTKLRQVEILVQQAQESGMDVVGIKDVFAVLYSTEEGFVSTGTESAVGSSIAPVAAAAAGDLH